MKHSSLVWGVTAISVVLGYMLTVQITSRPSYTTKPTSYIDLKTQVQEQTQEHQLLEQDISKATAQLDEYKAASGSKVNMKQVLEQDKQAVEAQAGITAVKGPGLTITIQDDYSLNADPKYMALFPQQSDQWISEVVNTLFGNGATAISVNGQRLVTTSSIRLVTGLNGIGGLHVNGHPVTMPYVVSAIGNIKNMQAALTVQQLKGIFETMGEDFIVKSYSSADGVSIPGYDGSLPGQWAKEGSGS